MQKRRNSRNMDRKPLKKEWEHLKPLSIYSKMNICDPLASLPHPGKLSYPLINFKIEVVNNCIKKRKLDDSSVDEGYETPAKESSGRKAPCSDLGSVVDWSSPPFNTRPPLVISKPVHLGRTAARREIKAAVGSQLCQHVGWGSCPRPGGKKGAVPPGLRSEKLLLNVVPTFDCDVDNILCLNPVGASTAGGFLDNVESCKTANRSTFHHAQGRRDEQMDGKQEEQRKRTCLGVEDVEEDKGYFSLSYIKGLGLGQKPPELSHTASSPLLRFGGVKVSQGCAAVCGPLLESVASPLEPLEGDVEEELTLGPPIFESSVCHSATLSAGSECGPTPDGHETTLDSSYDSTLPLQVQVKSVVVAPSQLTSSKPATLPQQEHSANPAQPFLFDSRASRGARIQRPVVFERKVDWEREKQLYVHSVSRHINENSGTAQDVMAELLMLMRDVAEQTPSSSGSEWQHPSDLTCRNYQRRFGNMRPKMALHEWQAKSCPKYKRFAKVPKYFERSPLP